MTQSIAKTVHETASSPATALNADRSLRCLISNQIELLIEILDRLDGDPDVESEPVEDEHLEEAWAQPVSLGPVPRTFRRRERGFSEREQSEFGPHLAEADAASVFHLNSTPPRYPGLRQRVRDRLVQYGSDVATNVELLGALLSLVMPCNDPEAMAHRLIHQFGSFSAALAAPVAQLASIEGIGRVSAANLKIVLAAAKRFGRDQIDFERPILSSWSQLIDYCHVTMAFEDVEQLRVLLLNRRNRLIADEVQQRGTVDHTPVYPRQVIKRSLELGASALILVHNHPSGDPSPSTSDVHMTKEIIIAGKPLGIVVHDHIIIGKEGHASLKALRLI